MGQKNRRVAKPASPSTGSQTPPTSLSNPTSSKNASPKPNGTKPGKAAVAKSSPLKDESPPKGLGFKSYQNGILKTNNFDPVYIGFTASTAPKLNAHAVTFSPQASQKSVKTTAHGPAKSFQAVQKPGNTTMNQQASQKPVKAMAHGAAKNFQAAQKPVNTTAAHTATKSSQASQKPVHAAAHLPPRYGQTLNHHGTQAHATQGQGNAGGQSYIVSKGYVGNRPPPPTQCAGYQCGYPVPTAHQQIPGGYQNQNQMAFAFNQQNQNQIVDAGHEQTQKQMVHAGNQQNHVAQAQVQHPVPQEYRGPDSPVTQGYQFGAPHAQRPGLVTKMMDLIRSMPSEPPNNAYDIYQQAAAPIANVPAYNPNLAAVNQTTPLADSNIYSSSLTLMKQKQSTPPTATGASSSSQPSSAENFTTPTTHYNNSSGSSSTPNRYTQKSSAPANAPKAPASMHRAKTFIRRFDVNRKDIIVSGPDLIRNLVRVTRFQTPDGVWHEELFDEFHPDIYDFAADLKTLTSRERRHYYRETELEICIDVAAENAEGEGESVEGGSASSSSTPPQAAAASGKEDGEVENEKNDKVEVKVPGTPQVVCSSMANLSLSDSPEAVSASSPSKDKGKGKEIEVAPAPLKRNIITTLLELDTQDFEFSHSISNVTVVLNYPLNYDDTSRSSPCYNLITQLVSIIQTYTNLRHLDIVMFVPEDREKRDLLDVSQAELALPFYDLGFTDWRLMFQLPYMSSPEEVTGWIISHLDAQMRGIMVERDRALMNKIWINHSVAPRPANAAPPIAKKAPVRQWKRPQYLN